MTSQMSVIATAGHVDHGKSTLVKALTGSDPDRLAAEHQRGLTIELGFAWADLDGCGTVAFVDVPGHEKFISTMLSGIGTVPACLFVVAADDPWMPQAAEHLAALEALGVSHGVIAVTRSDLADPGPIITRVREQLNNTHLANSPIVSVSAITGAGMDELRIELAQMVNALPAPDPDADVRLWADRRFSIKGIGTVITGTLGEGTIRVGDEFNTAHGLVKVRGIHALNASRESIGGAARVALNLSGEADGLSRGDVLWQPDMWHTTRVVDVRIITGQGKLPRTPVLHIGSESMLVKIRRIDETHLRLELNQALPLRQGDRALLRDPGSRRLWGVRVLDPNPPELPRRGGVKARGGSLSSRSLTPNFEAELEAHGIVDSKTLRQLGIRIPNGPRWHMSSGRRKAAAADLATLIIGHDRDNPLDPGLPIPVIAHRLGLPDPALVPDLISPPLRIDAGHVASTTNPVLPDRVLRALEELAEEFADNIFGAPTANRLRQLELTGKDLAAAARAGRIFQPAPGIVLPMGAAKEAVTLLKELPQPFTTSQAREHLDTSRRIMIPILDFLDRARITRRLPDDRRTVLS